MTLPTGSSVTGATSVTLNSDAITLNGTVTSQNNTATGLVALAPFTSGLPISLGTVVAGSFSLTSAQLNNIFADSLKIGNDTSGNIAVSAAIAIKHIHILILVIMFLVFMCPPLG